MWVRPLPIGISVLSTISNTHWGGGGGGGASRACGEALLIPVDMMSYIFIVLPLKTWSLMMLTFLSVGIVLMM